MQDSPTVHGGKVSPKNVRFQLNEDKEFQAAISEAIEFNDKYIQARKQEEELTSTQGVREHVSASSGSSANASVPNLVHSDEGRGPPVPRRSSAATFSALEPDEDLRFVLGLDGHRESRRIESRYHELTELVAALGHDGRKFRREATRSLRAIVSEVYSAP